MVDEKRDDDPKEEEASADGQCPNCGSPVAWEDVCAECGCVLDDEADAEETLDDDLDLDKDEQDYDLEEIERENYGIDEFDEMEEFEEDPFKEEDENEEL